MAVSGEPRQAKAKSKVGETEEDSASPVTQEPRIRRIRHVRFNPVSSSFMTARQEFTCLRYLTCSMETKLDSDESGLAGTVGLSLYLENKVILL